MSKGMVYPDGHEESREEVIKRLAAQKVSAEPKMVTPLPEKRDFSYWIDRFQTRQEQALETREFSTNHVEIDFPQTVCLNLIGDVHTGGAYVDYGRLKQEVEAIYNAPNSYVLLIGDLVDGFFWGGESQMQEIEQVPEQVQFTNSLLEYLAERKKLLIGWGGDHDGWAKKMGMSMYTEFADKFHAHYMQGLGFLTAKVDGVKYQISAAHRLPGHSMYNKNHPQVRAERNGGAWGSDVIVSGHTHQKGYSNAGIAEFGGTTRQVHYISVGPYKYTDDYAQKLGFAQQGREELFGSAIILHSDRKKVEYYSDILEANERIASL